MTPERQTPEEARLRRAILQHKRKVRPSLRSEADRELYRSLTQGGEERPTAHVVPPAAYAQAAERYYDSPY